MLIRQQRTVEQQECDGENTNLVLTDENENVREREESDEQERNIRP